MNTPTASEQCFVYILRTSANTLYTGQTNNLKKRLEEHTKKKSRSAKYMKAFCSFTLVYTEVFASRREAMQREYALKQLTKAEKELLILHEGLMVCQYSTTNAGMKLSVMIQKGILEQIIIS